MSKSIRFSYRFHPVGQGLFANGYLMKNGESEPHFAWVYDCGTSSSPKFVTNGIGRLDKEVGNHGKIDLLVLSHFDHDHISGVCRLLAKFRIGTLMLPYMSLAQRLVIAFEEGSGSAEEVHTQFYLNPVAFLLAQDGPGIGRILFVPPSGREGPPLLPGAPDQPDDDEPDSELRFNPDKPDDRDEVMLLVDAAQGSAINTSVEFLRKGTAMTLGSYWEFVPYNDDPEIEITDEFVAVAKAEGSKLRKAADFKSSKEALKRLKQVYDRHFGDDSEARNVISLHLYAGPVYPTWSCTWLQLARWSHQQWNQLFEFRHTPSLSPHVEYGTGQCSILYTGDGYLDNFERLRNLIAYLHELRVRSTGIFQVMHHGSKANWHSGVGSAISPLFSIFSSDPNRLDWKHPHAAVVRDFWNYGPVQVDKQRSFQAWGILEPMFEETHAHVFPPFVGDNCPECGSQMMEGEFSVDHEDDEIYHIVRCRECNWGGCI